MQEGGGSPAFQASPQGELVKSIWKVIAKVDLKGWLKRLNKVALVTSLITKMFKLLDQ